MIVRETAVVLVLVLVFVEGLKRAEGSLDCVDGVGCHRFQVCDLCFFCFQIGLVGRAWAAIKVD